MKKVVLITVLSLTALSADMMSNLAKDAVATETKSKIRSVAVEKIAGDNVVTKTVVNTVADKVLGKEDPVEKVKADVVGNLLGTKKKSTTTKSDVTNVVKSLL